LESTTAREGGKISFINPQGKACDYRNLIRAGGKSKEQSTLLPAHFAAGGNIRKRRNSEKPCEFNKKNIQFNGTEVMFHLHMHP